MKIYYQGILWAYSSIVAQMIADKMQDMEIEWVESFATVWKNISEDGIGVLPMENSYAGSIHENFKKFLEYDCQIIWETELKVNHCLLSKETDISKIKKAYSHIQALAQCQDFLKEHDIEPVIHNDTAQSARFVAQSDESGIASIASAMAGQIYNLNVLKSHIQDQDHNTTRFFVIAKKHIDVPILPKNKTTVLFEMQDKPWSLLKCLNILANHNINITKLESIPTQKSWFTYYFRLDLDGRLDEETRAQLRENTVFFKILWEY